MEINVDRYSGDNQGKSPLCYEGYFECGISRNNHIDWRKYSQII